jgi:hypothetical protein
MPKSVRSIWKCETLPADVCSISSALVTGWRRALAEGRNDGLEFGDQQWTEGLKGCDCGDRDQRDDEPVFDHRGAVFVLQQLWEPRQIVHWEISLVVRFDGRMIAARSFPRS